MAGAHVAPHGGPRRPSRCRADRPRAPAASGPRLVAVSVVFNLSLLGFFKYFDFFVEQLRRAGRRLGITAPRWHCSARSLPVGISLLHLPVDELHDRRLPRRMRRRRAASLDFALFVSFFPQLVAGPIERAARSAAAAAPRPRASTRASVCARRRPDPAGRPRSRRSLIADPLAPRRRPVFADPGSSAPVDAAASALYAFALPDLLRLLRLHRHRASASRALLGFDLPRELRRSPTSPRAITEFWRRWHISLSHLAARLPLHPARRQPAAAPRAPTRNLLLTMLLGGLWHGAELELRRSGARLHGAALAAERRITPEKLYGRLPGPLRTALVFGFVTLAWIPFRAKDFPSALDFLARLFGIQAAARRPACSPASSIPPIWSFPSLPPPPSSGAGSRPGPGPES